MIQSSRVRVGAFLFPVVVCLAVMAGCTDVERKFPLASDEGGESVSSSGDRSGGAGEASGDPGSGDSGQGGLPGGTAEGSVVDSGEGGAVAQVRLRWEGDVPDEAQRLGLVNDGVHRELEVGVWTAFGAGTWSLESDVLEWERADGLLERRHVEELGVDAAGASALVGGALALEAGDAVELVVRVRLELARVDLRLTGLAAGDECYWLGLAEEEGDASSGAADPMPAFGVAEEDGPELFDCGALQSLVLPPGAHVLDAPVHFLGAPSSQIDALFDASELEVALSSGDVVEVVLAFRDRGLLFADPGLAALRALIADSDIGRLRFADEIPDVLLPEFRIEGRALEFEFGSATEVILAAPEAGVAASVEVGPGGTLVVRGGVLTHAHGLASEMLRVSGGYAQLADMRVELHGDLQRPETLSVHGGVLLLRDVEVRVALDSSVRMGPASFENIREWMAEGAGVLSARGGEMAMVNVRFDIRSLPLAGALLYAEDGAMLAVEGGEIVGRGVGVAGTAEALALIAGRAARVRLGEVDLRSLALAGAPVLCAYCEVEAFMVELRDMRAPAGAFALLGFDEHLLQDTRARLARVRVQEMESPTLVSAVGDVWIEGSEFVETLVSRSGEPPAMVFGGGEVRIEGSVMRFAERTGAPAIRVATQESYDTCLASGLTECAADAPVDLRMAFSHVVLHGGAGSLLWSPGDISLQASIMLQGSPTGPSLLPCERASASGVRSLGWNVLDQPNCLEDSGTPPGDVALDAALRASALAPSTLASGVELLQPVEGGLLDGLVPEAACVAADGEELTRPEDMLRPDGGACSPGAFAAR